MIDPREAMLTDREKMLPINLMENYSRGILTPINKSEHKHFHVFQFFFHVIEMIMNECSIL